MELWLWGHGSAPNHPACLGNLGMFWTRHHWESGGIPASSVYSRCGMWALCQLCKTTCSWFMSPYRFGQQSQANGVEQIGVCFSHTRVCKHRHTCSLCSRGHWGCKVCATWQLETTHWHDRTHTSRSKPVRWVRRWNNRTKWQKSRLNTERIYWLSDAPFQQL